MLQSDFLQAIFTINKFELILLLKVLKTTLVRFLIFKILHLKGIRNVAFNLLSVVLCLIIANRMKSRNKIGP